MPPAFLICAEGAGLCVVGSAEDVIALLGRRVIELKRVTIGLEGEHSCVIASLYPGIGAVIKVFAILTVSIGAAGAATGHDLKHRVCATKMTSDGPAADRGWSQIRAGAGVALARWRTVGAAVAVAVRSPASREYRRRDG